LGVLGEKEGKGLADLVDGKKRNTFATLPTISKHTTLTPSPKSLMSLKNLSKV